MSAVFHIHDVLDFLYSNPEKATTEELYAKISDKFGAEAHFFSCTVESMDIKEAIQFMLSRNKVVEVSPGYFSADAGNPCHH